MVKMNQQIVTWHQLQQGLRSFVMLGLILSSIALCCVLFLQISGLLQQYSVTGVVGMVVLLAGGGALVLLFAAPWVTRYLLGVRTITQPADSSELGLLMSLRNLSQQAGISPPRLGIIERPVINAFTAGINQHTAQIVLSRGLVQALNQDELEAVLAHEIAHIVQGDIHSVTLVQGAVNMVTVLPARLSSLVVDRFICRQKDPAWCYFIVLILTQISWGWLASLVAGWFSRDREFRADQLGAQLVGHDKMIAALSCLQAGMTPNTFSGFLVAFGLADQLGEGLDEILITHPGLPARLAALRSATA